ncbi:MAG: hypothetical protein AABZ02_10050, partial [Bacteroidota bacterium]
MSGIQRAGDANGAKAAQDASWQIRVITMIGQTISHYRILEKSRPEPSSGRGCSFGSPSRTALG